jgi:hypothetical protein
MPFTQHTTRSYDLDDNKELTLAHIQTICARQFRQHQDCSPGTPHLPETLSSMSFTSDDKPEQYNKYKQQGGNELAAFLCNTLEQHGEQSGKVLRRAGLTDSEWNEPASITVLFMSSQKHFPSSVPSDTDDDNDTDYVSATSYESDDIT